MTQQVSTFIEHQCCCAASPFTPLSRGKIHSAFLSTNVPLLSLFTLALFPRLRRAVTVSRSTHHQHHTHSNYMHKLCFILVDYSPVRAGRRQRLWSQSYKDRGMKDAILIPTCGASITLNVSSDFLCGCIDIKGQNNLSLY